VKYTTYFNLGLEHKVIETQLSVARSSSLRVFAMRCFLEANMLPVAERSTSYDAYAYGLPTRVLSRKYFGDLSLVYTT